VTPRLISLLNESGASLAETDHRGNSALLTAAANGKKTTVIWLLEHGGADIAEANNAGQTVWELLTPTIDYGVFVKGRKERSAAVTALLRVMVVRGSPPARLVTQLRGDRPEHARVIEEGVRLRAALPAYMVRRRALLDAHCLLIASLRAIVIGYEPGPTTTEELWATLPPPKRNDACTIA
jgi:hypothetical protein